MPSGSLGLLLILLLLALAILSTAQAFDLFSRQSQPDPAPLVEPPAGEVSQLPRLVSRGDHKALSARDHSISRELWRIDAAPVVGEQVIAQHEAYELAVGVQAACCAAGDGQGR